MSLPRIQPDAVQTLGKTSQWKIARFCTRSYSPSTIENLSFAKLYLLDLITVSVWRVLVESLRRSSQRNEFDDISHMNQIGN